MNSQNGDSGPQEHGSSRWAMLGFLVAGLGIGAIAGVLLAPQSGEETGQRLGEMLGRGQQQVSEAVDAGRDAFREAKAGARL